MKYLNSFKNIALTLAVFFSVQANAQLTSCNVFLQGTHIEVGVNWNGAYGTSVATPSTGYCGTAYHPKGPAGEGNSALCGGSCYNSGQNLGFVADPDKDGWTVGSPYPYYGDYFLPGSPQEGWAIQAEGITGWTFNAYGCGTTLSSNITGSKNISYSTSGNRITSLFQSTFDNIEVDQVTTLDTSTVYFTVYMTLKNLTSTTKKDVYYLRTVDPDNAQPETGSFTTINKIEFQMPNPDNKVMVSAVGVKPATTFPAPDTAITSAFLGLGTKDCRAKCFVHTGGTLLEPTLSTTPTGMVPTLDSMYNGHALNSSGNPLYSYANIGGLSQNPVDTQDVGISLVFKLGDLLPNDSITFAYAYVLRRADIDSAFASTQPKWRAVTTYDSNVHVSGDSVIVCAGTRIPLSMVNGSGFIWHWVSVTGDSLSDTVGLKTTVKVNRDTTVVLAIGSTPACGADTVRIILPPYTPPPPVVSNNSPLCIGDTLKLFATSLPNANFVWKGPNGYKSNLADPVKYNIQPADSGLFYVLDSVPGCPPRTTSTNVLVDAVIANIGHRKPDACLGADFPVYFVGRVPDTNTHFAWTFDNSIPVAGDVTGMSKGPYTLRWDSLGTKTITLHVQNWRCKASDQITVPIIIAPPVHFDLPHDVCVTADVPLIVPDYTLAGSDSLMWNYGGGDWVRGGTGGSVGNVHITYTTSGKKAVTLTVDYLLCTAKPYTDTVTVHDLPDAHIIPLTHSVCEGDTVTFNANVHDFYTYSWSPARGVNSTQGIGGNAASITIPNSSNVYLKVIDQYLCVNYDTMYVNADVCCTVSFPSAFTPNGDGRNDVFKPITIGHHHIYHFKVLNRYGQVVYESNEENRGWDGTLFGKPQDMDTYFWFFFYDCNGRKMEEKGDVILIR